MRSRQCISSRRTRTAALRRRTSLAATGIMVGALVVVVVVTTRDGAPVEVVEAAVEATIVVAGMGLEEGAAIE